LASIGMMEWIMSWRKHTWEISQRDSSASHNFLQHTRRTQLQSLWCTTDNFTKFSRGKAIFGWDVCMEFPGIAGLQRRMLWFIGGVSGALLGREHQCFTEEFHQRILGSDCCLNGGRLMSSHEFAKVRWFSNFDDYFWCSCELIWCCFSKICLCMWLTLKW